MTDFNITVEVRYIAGESDPDQNRYVFAYTITIENRGQAAARLMNRYWRITNSDGEIQEVAGEGVVGKQPMIEPGSAFRYTSAAILETQVGSMEGHYEFEGDSTFIVDIPPFSLSLPNVVH